LIIFFGGRAAIPDTQVIFLSALGLAALLILVTAVLPRAPDHGRGAAAAVGSMGDLVSRPGLIRALTVSCVVLAAVDISLVYLPILGTERGIAAGTIGALLTVRAVFSMTSRFFLGGLVSWIGRSRLLVGSVLMAAVGMALAPAPMPVWLLALVVAAMGFGLGAGQPMTMSWLAEATPPGLRGRAMSLRLTGNRLGHGVVPSAVGMVAIGTGAAGVLWFTLQPCSVSASSRAD
jgi:MFS family permease